MGPRRLPAGNGSVDGGLQAVASSGQSGQARFPIASAPGKAVIIEAANRLGRHRRLIPGAGQGNQWAMRGSISVYDQAGNVTNTIDPLIVDTISAAKFE
jgi:hypothetical protein